jgi:hypothetical protein
MCWLRLLLASFAWLCCCCSCRTLAHRLEPLRKLLTSAANAPAEAVDDLDYLALLLHFCSRRTLAHRLEHYTACWSALQMCLPKLLLTMAVWFSCCTFQCSCRTLAHRLEPLRKLLISAANVPAEAVDEYRFSLCCCCMCRTLAHRLEPLRNLLISTANVPAEAVADNMASLCRCCTCRTLAHRLEPLRSLLVSAANIPAEAIADINCLALLHLFLQDACAPPTAATQATG